MQRPQVWQIVLPRIKQKLELAADIPYCDTRLLFDSCATWDTWSRLARPAACTVQTCSRRKQHSQGLVPCLESLPVELLEMILSYPGLSKADIMSLGMASETLWSHTLQHVDKDYRRSPSVGSWAGYEIACTGTYLIDLPPSFNRDNLALNSVSITNDGKMCTAENINWAMLEKFNRSRIRYGRLEWSTAFFTHVVNQTHIPWQLVAPMSEELLSVFSRIWSPPADEPWILRNLVTKEFVRCLPTADFQGRRGYVDHPRVKWLRLSGVLTMRICWTIPNMLGRYPPLNASGQWAGHSFDIVPLDETRGTLSDAWTDVTDAIVDEAQKHFESHWCAFRNTG